MIGFLEGKILERSEDHFTIGIGDDQNRVGYRVTVPQGSEYQQKKNGDIASLYIYSHIREDAFDLYGFLGTGEKEVFMSLISVNGIGPRVGLAVLSRLSVGEIVRAILNKDKKFLTQVPGIGKKTAERVVIELHDRVEKKVENGAWAAYLSEFKGSPSAGASVHDFEASPFAQSEAYQDVRLALQTLGYKDVQIKTALEKVFSEEGEERSAESLVRLALQQLS